MWPDYPSQIQRCLLAKAYAVIVKIIERLISISLVIAQKAKEARPYVLAFLSRLKDDLPLLLKKKSPTKNL